jgi:hypothetical protein
MTHPDATRYVTDRGLQVRYDPGQVTVAGVIAPLATPVETHGITLAEAVEAWDLWTKQRAGLSVPLKDGAP